MQGIAAHAQVENYKVLSNEVTPSSRLSVNTDLFQMDLMQNSLDGTSFNLGVWGHYDVVPEQFGTQFLLRKSWFALGRLGEKNMPGNTELELGGYYTFRNAVKRKDTKVTLKMEYSGTTYSTDYKGDRVGSYSTTETFIMIPSDKKKYLMARGGIYRKSHGNSMRYLGDEYNLTDNPEFVKFATTGVYLGINSRTLTSLFIDSENYGVQFNSIGRDVFLDLLILPSNKFKDLDGNDITSDIKLFKKSSPFGMRVGYKLFQIDKQTKTGKTFGMSATFEGGIKPYDGIYLAAGIGLTIIK